MVFPKYLLKTERTLLSFGPFFTQSARLEGPGSLRKLGAEPPPAVKPVTLALALSSKVLCKHLSHLRGLLFTLMCAFSLCRHKNSPLLCFSVFLNLVEIAALILTIPSCSRDEDKGQWLRLNLKSVVQLNSPGGVSLKWR